MLCGLLEMYEVMGGNTGNCRPPVHALAMGMNEYLNL